MTYEIELVTAIAELLDAAGVSEWQSSGAYAPTGGPITVIRTVPDVARAVVTLSTYPVLDAWGWDDHVTGVQVRTRYPGTNPLDVDQLDDAIYQLLHGRHGAQLGPHRISKISRQSGASLGPDENKRWARSSNYYVHGPRN